MRRTALFLAVLGLGLALGVSWILLARSLDLLGNAETTADVCSAVFGSGCDETLADPASTVFGVPVAGWGVLYAGTGLLLFALGSFLDETFRRLARGLLGLLLLAGAVASVWLVVGILRGDVALCPLCLLFNLLNLSAFGLYTWSRGRERRAEWSALLAGSRGPNREARADATAARWRMIGVLFVLLAAATAYQRILLEARERAALADDIRPETILRAFLTAPRRDLHLDGTDAYLGSADAPVDLVVFGDAWCPHCRRFWKTAQGLVDRYGSDLRIVFKHLPLDKTCNLGVAATIHPGACDAALGLEAARRQDRFWPYYEAISRADPEDRQGAVREAAIVAGLDLERFDADVRDEATRDHVERDVALGRELGFDGVPVFFLDGRHVPDPPFVAIPILLDHLLPTPPGRAP